MAEKKKTTKTTKKPKIGKAPSLTERITDFSLGGMTDIKYVPKKKVK